MRYIYRIFAWVGIGFGYQVMAYGPDAWTSMLMVGHVLGWPIFLLAWLVSAILSIGIWFIVGIVLLLAGIYIADKVLDWRRRATRRAAFLRRTAR